MGVLITPIALTHPRGTNANPRAVPENYRKISVTPAIGKIFDGILNNRLQFAKECLGTGDPL